MINDQLEVLVTASANYPTYVERPDVAEQRPEEWISAISQAWREVRVARPDVSIDAVVLTAQMPTLVELDDRNQVIDRAVTWQDSRAEEFVTERLSADERNRICEVAGTPIDGRYLIPMYFHRRHAELPEPATILSAKDFVFHVLTDRKWTDPSTASGFGNYDLAAQHFSDELNSLWGFDAQLLPTVKPSNSSAMLAPSGEVVLDGLGSGRIPVVLGAADSVAAFHYVERIFGPAMAIIDGSSTVILGAADDSNADHPKLLITPLVDSARCGVEMDLLATGSSIAWLANLFNRSETDLETLALAVEDKAANPILFSPYLSGGEQGALWRTDLSGVISNLSLSSSQGDIALALYEGIAYEVLRCLDVLASPSVSPAVVWLVGSFNDGLLPALVSALGHYRVTTVRGLSPSLLGAALIALEDMKEMPDLAALRDSQASTTLEFDPSYVAALSAKRRDYLAAFEGST